MKQIRRLAAVLAAAGIAAGRGAGGSRTIVVNGTTRFERIAGFAALAQGQVVEVTADHR